MILAKDNPLRLLSRKDAAEYLSGLGYPISAKTLANMAANRNKLNGPAFFRVGWCMVGYRREDLSDWAQSRMVRVG